jgi:hypothetical protein
MICITFGPGGPIWLRVGRGVPHGGSQHQVLAHGEAPPRTPNPATRERAHQLVAVAGTENPSTTVAHAATSG